MNEANQITSTTRLYGFIAEEAQQNRFAVTLNRLFKSEGDDAMMIPMNIRPDDFYFTLSNMKQSHVNGAVIGFEYQQEAMALLDAASALCEQSGICDTVRIVNGTMHGTLLMPEAVKAMIDACKAKKIAVIGTTPLAMAMTLLLRGYELGHYDAYVEALMRLQERAGFELDINRLAEGMAVDLGGFDLLLDLSEMDDLSMVTALPPLNIDLKMPRKPSALRQRCVELGAAYNGYESLLDIMTKQFYTSVKKEQHEPA